MDTVKIIVDSNLRTPLESQVLQAGKVIILTTQQALQERAAELESRGAVIIACGGGPQVNLQAAMEHLGEREIGSVLLEGGARLNGAMLQQKLIDKCYLFYAPKIIGGSGAPSCFEFEGFDQMKDAITLERISVMTFEPDICLIGYPDYRKEDS